MKKKTLIYIYGLGRSGSTLVGQVLGASENSICIGEFASFTTYDDLGTELSEEENIHSIPCGCGKPTLECSENPLKYYLDRYKLFGVRKWFSNFGLLFPQDSEINEYLDSLKYVYEGLEVDVIVDTSKNPRLYHMLKTSKIFKDWNVEGILVYRNIFKVWKSWRSDKIYLKRKSVYRLTRHLIGQSFWCLMIYLRHSRTDLLVNFKKFRDNPHDYVRLFNERFGLNININKREIPTKKISHEVGGNPSKLRSKDFITIQ